MSTQLAAFKHLKNVMFKTEKFDNRIYEGDLAEIGEEEEAGTPSEPLDNEMTRQLDK